MEKDTKTESKNEPETKEFYDDEYENEVLMDEAIHGNMKNDPASKRSRPKDKNYNREKNQKPYFKSIWELTLDDEEKIPKMPEKILKEPESEKNLNTEIEAIQSEIDKKKQTLNELYNKIDAERTGIKKEDKNNIFEMRKNLQQEKKNLLSEINKEEESIKNLVEERTKLKDEMKKYEKFHYPNKIYQVQNQIKNIQEELSFGSLTPNEEKKKNIEKDNLNEYLKFLQKFHKFFADNKENLNKTKEPKKKLKEINEKLKKIYDEIKISKEKQKEISINSEQIINQIYEQIKNVKKQKDELFNKKNELIKNWEDDWYYYEKQQREIKYIKDAQEKIKNLKKQKLRKENMEKKNKEKNQNENVSNQIEYKKKQMKYEKEIEDCNILIKYFESIFNDENETKTNENETNENNNNNVNKEKSKIDEDIEKGLLKVLTKKDYSFGVQGAGKKKKKEKNQNKVKEILMIILFMLILD